MGLHCNLMWASNVPMCRLSQMRRMVFTLAFGSYFPTLVFNRLVAKVSPPAFLLIGTCGFESNHPKGLPSPLDSNINGVEPRLPGEKKSPQFLSQTFRKSNKGHLRVVHILSRMSSVHKWFPIAWLERFALCITWSNQQEKRGYLDLHLWCLEKVNTILLMLGTIQTRYVPKWWFVFHGDKSHGIPIRKKEKTSPSESPQWPWPSMFFFHKCWGAMNWIQGGGPY